MKKILKKMVLLFCVGALAIGGLSGCTLRSNQLKIYNWGDYMDPAVIDGFADWYFEQTGEKVKVVYKSFDTNETMYESTVTKNKDWDLVCPSDYMIEKMLIEGKAEKLDKTIIGDYSTDGSIDDYLLDIINSLGGDDIVASDYMIPYVWGTFGIMYDSETVNIDWQNSSWEYLWSDDYAGDIYMKDSVRDSYAVASLYANRQALSDASAEFSNYGTAEYQKLLNDIFKVYDSTTIAAAKNALLTQRGKTSESSVNKVKKYEVDDGKTELYAGNGKLGLFWSCDAGFVMNDFEVEGKGCAKGYTTEGNKNLFYTVPREGSNIWIDGWLIPTQAKNKKAANYFLKYLMYGSLGEDSVAILNAMYAGAPTPNADAMAEYYDLLEEDEDGFFEDAPEGFRDMYMSMMFPDSDILQRCGVMGDFGDMFGEMNDMWVDVKKA